MRDTGRERRPLAEKCHRDALRIGRVNEDDKRLTPLQNAIHLPECAGLLDRNSIHLELPPHVRHPMVECGRRKGIHEYRCVIAESRKDRARPIPRPHVPGRDDEPFPFGGSPREMLGAGDTRVGVDVGMRDIGHAKEIHQHTGVVAKRLSRHSAHIGRCVRLIQHAGKVERRPTGV